MVEKLDKDMGQATKRCLAHVFISLFYRG